MNALQTTRTQETFKASGIIMPLRKIYIKVLCITNIKGKERRMAAEERRAATEEKKAEIEERNVVMEERKALNKSKSSCSWTQVVLMTRRKHTWSFVAIKCWR